MKLLILIVKANDFKYFKYKTKLIRNTEADGLNGILRNTTIAEALKYLSSFCQSLEIPLTNYKVELELKWLRHCVLSLLSTENYNADSNIILLSKTQKVYVPVVTLSAKANQKLSKRLSQGFERSVYCNEWKTKSESKVTTNEYRYSLKSKFVGVNRLLVLIYSNQNNDVKRYNAKKYCLPKRIIKNYNVIINGKNVYEKPIDSGIK